MPKSLFLFRLLFSRTNFRVEISNPAGSYAEKKVRGSEKTGLVRVEVPSIYMRKRRQEVCV